MFSANWSAGIISICSHSTRFWDADSSRRKIPRRTGIRSRLSVTSFGRNLAVIATSLVAPDVEWSRLHRHRSGAGRIYRHRYRGGAGDLDAVGDAWLDPAFGRRVV